MGTDRQDALLRNLIEAAWLNYVRSVNREVLGQSADLGAFLFGAERASLDAYRPVLREVQKDECFYCHSRLGAAGDVDHFVPWSRYPLDLGHNFVLAHSACNARKSDHLAAEEHLDTWVERNNRHGPKLAQCFMEIQACHDLGQSISIARWAYSQTDKSHGLVWVCADELRALPISPSAPLAATRSLPLAVSPRSQ